MAERPEADGRSRGASDRRSVDLESRSHWDWLGRIGFVVAIASLAFFAGAYIVLDRAPAYSWLKNAHQAATALYRRVAHYDDPMKTDAWAHPRTSARGVTIHKPDKAYQGLTLYTSGHDARAFLVDMTGKVIHQWHLPFSQAQKAIPAAAEKRRDAFVYMRKAHLYPNGDLLAVYVRLGDTPWGLGLVKMDRNSNVIWSFRERAHHDVAVGKDGRIYALTHAMRHDPVPEYKHLEPPIIEDFLVILSADGTVQKRISLLDALLRSRFRRLFYTVTSYSVSDPMHTNTVELVTGPGAAKFPYGKEGDVILSFRELGLIAVLDPEREAITWAMRGPWLGQHDPDLLPNGNILLFDNAGHLGRGGISRVIEVDPRNGAIVWSYTGTREKPFSSIIRSAQQRLPNGNTLITESSGGRLFEVTLSGEIVWEYINPIRGREGDYEKIPVVSWGQRFAISDLAPSFLPH